MKFVRYFEEGIKYLKSYFPSEKDVCSVFPDFVTEEGESFSWNVTGFLYWRNTVIIIFPKNYFPSCDVVDIRKDSRILLNALIRFSESYKVYEDDKVFFGQSLEEGEYIANVKYLIDDYYENGLYFTERSELTSDSVGKVDWAYTVNETRPLLINGDVIYPELYSRENVSDEANEVRSIHKFVLRQIFREWNWLFGLDWEDEWTGEDLHYSNEVAIDFLTKELMETFNTRENDLLQGLISYFSRYVGNEKLSSTRFYLVKKFHVVWEKICSDLLDNDYKNLKCLVSAPKWKSSYFKQELNQIPDIIYFYKNILHVIDAKYYNYYYNSPGIQDVIKQFVYKKAVEESVRSGNSLVDRKTKIENVFLFPGDHAEDIKYLGYVDYEELPDFGKILAFSVNIRKLIECYSKYRDFSFREKLRDRINTILF